MDLNTMTLADLKNIMSHSDIIEVYDKNHEMRGLVTPYPYVTIGNVVDGKKYPMFAGQWETMVSFDFSNDDDSVEIYNEDQSSTTVTLDTPLKSIHMSKTATQYLRQAISTYEREKEYWGNEA